MILNKLFGINDILGTAMQASAMRNDVISNNIANADVPGFKKKAVRFESYLAKELNAAKTTKRVNLNRLKPTIMVEHENYNYRIDGNNVDIQQEMVYAYQNAVKYDFIAGSVINNYRRINMVLNSIK